MLPPKKIKNSDKVDRGKRSPAHRAWIRLHACCACGSSQGIECAHVRTGTDGGLGLKPSDKWTISLCRDCHHNQHQIGEGPFEKTYGLNMKKLAMAFYASSPHKHKLD